MSKNYNLPPSWLRVTLGAVINYGETDKVEPYEIPSHAWVLELEDIEKDTSKLLQRVTFDKRLSKSTKNRFSVGDVLYGKLRPYLNKILIADQDGYCSTEIIPLKPNEAVNGRYLYYWLKSPEFLNYVNSTSHGLNMPRLGTGAGLKSPFVLAPLNEQKRIADKLDTLISRLDACRERLKRIPLILKLFRQAILTSAFRGALTSDWRQQHQVEVDGKMLLERIRSEHREWWIKKQIEAMQQAGKQPKSDNWKLSYKHPEPVDQNALAKLPETWAWGSGAELVEPGAEIVYGIVQPGPKLNEGVPYVRGMDIENGKILLAQLMKTSSAIAARYSRSSLAQGDVLLGIIRATKVAIIPEELEGGNITQGTARFRPSSVIRTAYLADVLEAPETQSWLHRHYRGIDMPGLNLADVRRVPIPLAPLPEQEEIARRLNSLFAFADRIEARFIATSAKVEQLPSLLLAKAFSGELVSQDLNDEPASVLLEHIRAVKAAQITKPKGASKKNKPARTKMTKEYVIKVIQQLPERAFSFDELHERISGNYDSLKTIVFALLEEPEPSIEQVFDRNAKAMRFIRRNK